MSKELTISVIIPAFNAESTIGKTVESVLNQTASADEILVMDDGSTDNTDEIVESFRPRVTLFKQSNEGVSSARNALLRRACGDLIAMLDADDFWHPQYLEIQRLNFQKYPDAVASFTGFYNIYTESQISNYDSEITCLKTNLIEPLDLLELYSKASGIIIPSFCVIKYDAFRKIGESPFPLDLRITQDSYLWYRLALLGPFVQSCVKAGFYRIVKESLSYDWLLTFEDRVKAFQKICTIYEAKASLAMLKLARRHRVINYRVVAKYQMGVRNPSKARRHLLDALKLSFSLKSLALLIFTFLPRFLQPKWPCRYRTPFPSSKLA
jgi:glycosyltransferase involved in cell wall biosynthesis